MVFIWAGVKVTKATNLDYLIIIALTAHVAKQNVYWEGVFSNERSCNC